VTAPLLPGERVIVVEIGDPGPQVVQVGDDSAAVPVFVPGTGSGGSGGGAHAAQVDVPAPTLLVQAQHNLPWRPAGVLCIDTLDQIVEPAFISWPDAGITEITFGVPFTGTVYLS